MKIRTTVTATALATTLSTLGACSRVAGSAAAIPSLGPTVSPVPAVPVNVTSPAGPSAPVSPPASSPVANGPEPANPVPPTSDQVSTTDSPQPADTQTSDDPTSPDQGQPAETDATIYNAALDMSDTTDSAGIEKVNSAVDQRITTLGSNNAALQAMSSGSLAGIAKAVPACRKVAELSAGT